MQLNPHEIFAWGVLLVLSTAGFTWTFGVIRTALRCSRCEEQAGSAMLRLVASGSPGGMAALEIDPETDGFLRVLLETAMGSIDALETRVGEYVDVEHGGQRIRQLLAIAKLMPFAGLFGMVLGLLGHLSTLGQGQAWNPASAALAMRTTAVGIGLAMLFFAVAAFVGEPAFRRVARAHILEAYRAHDHAVWLRQVFPDDVPARESVRQTPRQDPVNAGLQPYKVVDT